MKMNKTLTIDKYGTVKDSETNDTFLLSGVALTCGAHRQDAEDQTREMVNRWNEFNQLTEENEKLKSAIKSFYKACETENETEVQSSMEAMMDLVDCLELTNKGK